MLKLSLWQKIILKINGSVFVGYEQREGWSQKNPIYAVKCPKHGLYSGLRHGHYDAPPQCPKCMREIVKKIELTKQKNLGEKNKSSGELLKEWWDEYAEKRNRGETFC